MTDAYSVNFIQDYHFLVALISHLSATQHKNRTPRDIAGSLAMDHQEVERVLLAYPGFFRQSINRSQHTGERLFTVHLRYALRRKGEGSNNYNEPLPPDSIALMLSLVAEMVSNERQESRMKADLQQRNKATRWTVLVAVGTALLSSFTALLVAIVK
ncbi:hypothetical protein EZV61_15085 [Corallincola luteus]|uniref:Uncharacterized protein n=2 Tax=Corallincola TaxID=1775176 RepID=A0A368N501_9GAMM|nr:MULTISPECIES: hypothetical protein [Corallincola]RCU45632.1 hypothetical protein DU002_14295 [Corallincola holothuriorum]TCI02252.1 hypothetical protein EZV61_15085 [Corallincola luteus]